MADKFNIDPLKEVEHAARSVSDIAEKSNRRIFKKYPITFSFLSLLGFALVLYGFERMFDQIAFLQDKPWVALVSGLILLLATGTIYKWLQNKTVSLN